MIQWPQLVVAVSDISQITRNVGYVIYLALGLVALWGAFCLILVWLRVSRQRFPDESTQGEFLGRVESLLAARDYGGVERYCAEDVRALSQLTLLGVRNRALGYGKIRQLLIDRFERDVLADLEHRLSWVNTVIKSAPMLGLLGTVIGMMGAFGKLSANQNVNPNVLAEDISLALITTACGLSIAIPLLIFSESVRVRIRKLEDLVESGMNRLLEALRSSG